MNKHLFLNKHILLICGVASTIIYVVGDTVAAIAYPGYSYRDQAISELSAIGAPTKIIWIVFAFLFNPLIIAFGIGVRRVAQTRSLKVTGILLIVWGVLGFLWLFFPMNIRGEIGSFTDTMHLVMTGITVLLITAFIGFGSNAQGKAFSVYSWLTILIMLTFGILVSLQEPQVVAQLPTPWMGVFERISVFSPMVWVSVLAILLLQKNRISFSDQT